DKVPGARERAGPLVAELRDELETARRSLERADLTAPAIDAILARADDRLAHAPDPGRAAAEPRRGRRGAGRAVDAEDGDAPEWRIGDQARSRSGGWTGRIATLDKGGRATLEAGAMRVSVELADLERSADGGGGASGGVANVAGSNVEALRASRARSVPLSLDLRGARVDEALSALDRYLEDASLAGLARVSVIHGLGTGALRDAVRSDAAAHPL